MAEVQVDHDRCVQCGLCISICDWHVLDTDDDDNKVLATRPDDCTYCMLCQDSCYEEAVLVAAP